MIANLFSILKERGVRTCHWKSNINLDRSLAGETDFDILVDRRKAQEFSQILGECGFRPVRSSPWLEYPSITNYLGYDKDTGKFIHLHVHYKILTGKSIIKEYHIPVEEYFLSETHYVRGIPVPSPEKELFIHIVRIALKSSPVDIIKKAILEKVRGPRSDSRLEELNHLVRLSDLDKFDQFLVVPELKGINIGPIKKIAREGKRIGLIDWFSIARSLRHFRRFNKIQAYIYSTFRYRVKRWAIDHGGSKKEPVTGGCCVAVIGIDGSGKTTVVNEAINPLSRFLKVGYFYMGSSGESHNRPITAKLVLFLSRCFSLPFKVFPEKSSVSIIVRSFRRWLREYIFAKNRLKNYRKAQKMASNGHIILLERFPIIGIADHPADRPNSLRWDREIIDSDLSKRLNYSLEKIYSQIGGIDLIFVLESSLDLATKRKPAYNSEGLKTKHELLDKYIKNNQETNGCIVIDASRSVDEIVKTIVKGIWDIS